MENFMTAAISYIDEFYELIDKYNNASSNLRETLYKIKDFNTKVSFPNLKEIGVSLKDSSNSTKPFFGLVIENIDDFKQLIEKAQQQSAVLQEMEKEIQTFRVEFNYPIS